MAFGCARSKPVDFKPGEFRCEFCQMDIVDMRFKAEILTKKGKIHRFDSIECMMGWGKSHKEEIDGRWVSDFFHPERWIPLQKTKILKSDRRPSPMGASLSAYATDEEFDRAQKENGGVFMDLEALENYIEQQWQKDITEGKPHPY